MKSKVEVTPPGRVFPKTVHNPCAAPICYGTGAPEPGGQPSLMVTAVGDFPWCHEFCRYETDFTFVVGQIGLPEVTVRLFSSSVGAPTLTRLIR
jgi:hypothetical protein